MSIHQNLFKGVWQDFEKKNISVTQMFTKAVESGDIALTRRLLENPDVDPASSDQYALQIACFKGSTEIVRLLLADPRVDPSENDQSALRTACGRGRTEIVRLLLADPRVDPSVAEELLSDAIYDHYIEIVRLLLADPRVDPSVQEQAALRAACLRGYAEIVRVLLADPRVDPSAEEQDALQSACNNDQTEVVRILLADPRVDPSANEQYAIRTACSNGYTELVRLLLADPRVDPSIDDNDSLSDAIIYKNIEIARLLLADPRVNPRITPQKANELRTNLTIDFVTIFQQYKNDLPQLFVSVDHALEKEMLKKTAKRLLPLQTFEKHDEMNPNVVNTISRFSGNRNHKNTITRSLYKAKGNYFGPVRSQRKKTRKNKIRVVSRL